MPFAKKKAIALVISLAVVIVIVVLSTSIFTRAISESNLTKRYVKSAKAFWLAEAGAQKTLWGLNYDRSTWTGADKTVTETMTGIGDYEIVLVNNGGSHTVTSTGYIPNASDPDAIQRNIELTIDTETISSFSFAAFGDSFVTLGGNGETDSYNSDNGPYNPGSAGSNGDVGTNAATDPAITVGPQAVVNGDAVTGEGGTVSIQGTVSGQTGDTCYHPISQITVPSALTSLVSSGNINSDAAITSGQYKYSGLSIAGQTDVTISGDVTIYLTGDLSITGQAEIIIPWGSNLTIYTDGTADISGNGIANNTNIPSRCIINSTYSGAGDGVKITGNGAFYGAVYAPEADVKVTGNGDIYGSLIAKTVNIAGNGDVHYDEALQSISDPGILNYIPDTWREQKNPYYLPN
ncbi:MAG: hypothetical protein ABH872_02170 [Candidatus Omnitrophota bacterium]